MRLPQRPESHQLATDSINNFKAALPRNWDSSTPENDYGIDLVVHIFRDTSATGQELLVQLKASRNSNATTSGNSERITLNVSTYNMLMSKLQVVMLVKYVADENQAYWQLLSQIDEPNQSQETMTVHIPRKNVLSEITWQQISRYVDHIHHEKLGRRERINLGDFA